MKRTFAWLIVAACTYFCLPSYDLVLHRRNLSKDLATLTAMNDEMRAKTKTMEADIKSLNTSAKRQEQVIRDEMGYMRRNEITLILSD